jgi:hypothetical protein
LVVSRIPEGERFVVALAAGEDRLERRSQVHQVLIRAVGAVRAVELAQRDVERGRDHSAARDVGGVDQFVEPVKAPTSAVTFEGGRTLVEIVGCSDRRELCVSSIDSCSTTWFAAGRLLMLTLC